MLSKGDIDRRASSAVIMNGSNDSAGNLPPPVKPRRHKSTVGVQPSSSIRRPAPLPPPLQANHSGGGGNSSSTTGFGGSSETANRKSSVITQGGTMTAMVSDGSPVTRHRSQTHTGINGMSTPHSNHGYSSDTSDTSEDEPPGGPSESATQCPVPHEGREMMVVVVPLSVDDLFALIFGNNSSFMLDFLQNTRKTSDLQIGQWQESEKDRSVKCRTLSYSLPLPGGFTAKTTESQTLEVNRVGELYVVSSEGSNSGIPYADTFNVVCHYCFCRTGIPRQSRVVVYSQMKYKKSPWGIVKTFIEKTGWPAVQESFTQLKRNLQMAYPSQVPSIPAGDLKARSQRAPRMRRRTGVVSGPDFRSGGADGKPQETSDRMAALPSTRNSNEPNGKKTGSSFLLYSTLLVSFLVLVATNGYLYTKIWELEELSQELSKTSAGSSAACLAASNLADLRALTAQPKSPEDWLQILRQQEMVYRSTEAKWREALLTAADHLRQTKEALESLQANQVDPDAELIQALLERIRSPPPPSPPAQKPADNQLPLPPFPPISTS